MLRLKNLIRLFILSTILSLAITQESPGKAGAASGTEGALGTVNVDGETYNQIAIRPTIPIGKLKVALDVYLYFNDEGLYPEAWDFSDGASIYRTLMDKIYFVRYGDPGDDLYFGLGALPQSTLGQGILVNNYSNTQQYPDVRRIGVESNVKFGKFGIQTIVSDIKDLSQPGLIGLRGSLEPLNDYNIEVGLSYATDLNQKAGLLDTDGDGYPDAYDFYPTDADMFDDYAEFQEIYNSISPDASAGEFDEWWSTRPERNTYDASNEGTETVTALALDAVFGLGPLSLYSQFATIDGHGWGATPLGVSTSLPFGFIGRGEFRTCSDGFLFNFWDQAYDLERAVVSNNNTITKKSTLDSYSKMSGFFAELSGQIADVLYINLGYQMLMPGEDSQEASNSLLGEATLNTRKIPKLNSARVYYMRTNDDNPFDFENPSANTIHGYELSLEASDTVDLLYSQRVTYLADPATGEFTPVESMQIETKIKF